MASQSELVYISSNEISTKFNSIVYPYIFDISNYSEVQSLVELIIKKFGRIDAVINCAAIIGPSGPIEDNDIFEWSKTININLIGTFNLIHLVLKQMKIQGHGSIVNFSGGGAASPSPGFSSYGCSKAAVVRLTETVANEILNTSIRVNVIAPGANDTDMYRTFIKAGGIAKTIVTFDKPVKLALFLASEKSIGISGKFIHVYDDYENFISNVNVNQDLFTLRRIEP